VERVGWVQLSLFEKVYPVLVVKKCNICLDDNTLGVIYNLQNFFGTMKDARYVNVCCECIHDHGDVDECIKFMFGDFQ
jgi:hypothetical protein